MEGGQQRQPPLSSYQQEDVVIGDSGVGGSRQRGGGTTTTATETGGRIGGKGRYHDNPVTQTPPESIVSNNSYNNSNNPDYDNDDKKIKNTFTPNNNNNINVNRNNELLFLKCCSSMGCIDMSYFTEEVHPITGKYYYDKSNDNDRDNNYSSSACTWGTTDDDGIWMNTSDQAGTVMSLLVWFLLTYSMVTVSFLAHTNGIPNMLSVWYTIFCALALASHAKTTLTDPGSVPHSAVPPEHLRYNSTNNNSNPRLTMCSQCQTYKPLYSHHCRICNRCISRMDHHCPWMNNCIGAGNMKHFILFLVYTWTCSVFSLVLLGWNYFFCTTEDCTYHPILVQLVRVMTVLSVGSFLFTSSMIMNVSYGLMTGVGTIDRLKKKANVSLYEDSDEQPIPLKDVFGIGGYYTWLIPTDPIFDNYDKVMGYSIPQRLLREQSIRQRLRGNNSFYGDTGIDYYYNDGAESSVYGGGGSFVSHYTNSSYYNNTINGNHHNPTSTVINQNAYTRSTTPTPSTTK